MSERSAVSKPRRVLQVGVSYTAACGIRDYARVLGADLQRRGCSVSSAWWERDDDGALSPRTREGLRDWGTEVGDKAGGVDVVLWHYSVFGYGWRGIPVFANSAARRLARVGVPVVVLLHEFGHPWWWPGWRGLVFRATHRMALVPVLRCASRAVVTTEDRQRWIRRQWWLPTVPVGFEPVFSTVGSGTAPGNAAPVGGLGTTVGVFGYAATRMRADIVMEALRILGSDGMPVSLRLVGAPGSDGAGGQRWRKTAADTGGDTEIVFTGPLEPQDLSRVLATLDVVVFPDDAGPTSRKTTLAAVLAHGCCVVALDGAGAWPALIEEGAVVVAQADPEDLASRLRALLRDGEARRAQGARAVAFYDRHMAPDVVVERLWPLLFPPPAAMSAKW